MLNALASSSVAGGRRRFATPASGGGGSLPYTPPSAGVALAIGTNTADAVRPSGPSSFNWAYANFNGYGGGVFADDMGSYGSWMIASCGSHTAPCNNDALVFDFGTATWARLANTSSASPVDPNHFMSTDYTASTDVSSDGWWELTATANNTPGASHTYNNSVYVSASVGSTTKGEYLRFGSFAAGNAGGKNGSIHKMNLATGAWSRVTTGTRTDDYENVAVRVGSNVYFIQHLIHRNTNLQILALGTSVLDTTSGTGSAADQSAGGVYHCTDYDPGRNWLISHQSNFAPRVLQLSNLAAGWISLAETNGGSRPQDANRWAYSTTTLNFYTRGNADGNQCTKIVITGSTPGSASVTYSTLTFTGDALPNYTATGSNDGRRHYSNFFYVPGLDCLAWVSGETNSVIIAKPAS